MAARNVLGFSVAPHMRRVMAVNGFYASIMKAEKKMEDNKGLPLGTPIPVLPVDYLKVRPDHWIGGEGSYVCPVSNNWALWFNWSMNNARRTAVLASVKGMNPLTGERMGGYELAEYSDTCPIHNVKFQTGRLCPECGFKWPTQNYLSSPNPLFLDGFRTPEGMRQFYFTEEMSKSIPELVIGKEDTVPAFGFCFYEPETFTPKDAGGKKLKNEFPSYSHSNFMPFSRSWDSPRELLAGFSYASLMERHGTSMSRTFESDDTSMSRTFGSDVRLRDISRSKRNISGSISDEIYTTGSLKGMSFENAGEACLDAIGPISDDGPIIMNCCSDENLLTDGPDSAVYLTEASPFDTDELEIETPRERKSAEVGIGAGAKINHQILSNSKGADYWKKSPSAVMRLYFVFQEEFESYASAGFNDLEGSKEGFLESLPVGGN